MTVRLNKQLFADKQINAFVLNHLHKLHNKLCVIFPLKICLNQNIFSSKKEKKICVVPKRIYSKRNNETISYLILINLKCPFYDIYTRTDN